MPDDQRIITTDSPTRTRPDNLLFPFQRLDCYRAARELASRVHAAAISDGELRDQATRAAKSAFLNLCEGLPDDRPAMRRKYFAAADGSPPRDRRGDGSRGGDRRGRRAGRRGDRRWPCGSAGCAAASPRLPDEPGEEPHRPLRRAGHLARGGRADVAAQAGDLHRRRRLDRLGAGDREGAGLVRAGHASRALRGVEAGATWPSAAPRRGASGRGSTRRAPRRAGRGTPRTRAACDGGGRWRDRPRDQPTPFGWSRRNQCRAARSCAAPFTPRRSRT